MKRSEIEVGGSYYYDRSSNWQLYDYGRRAVVVAEGAWKVDRMTWQRTAPKPYQVDKGSGVLVDVYTHDGDEHPTREVVPTAHLRGPYEETAAQVDEWITQRRIRENAEAAARSTAHMDARRAMERAEALGFPVRTDGPNVVLTADVLYRLLDAAERGA